MKLGYVYFYLFVPVFCQRGKGGYQGFNRRGRFFDRRRHEFYRPTTFKPKVYDVDEILYGLLSKPSSSSGDVIFHYLNVFERMITEIFEGFKDHKYKYFEIANILYARGLPKFMDMTYDRKMLFAAYSWNIVEFAKFNNQIKNIFIIWRSFESSFLKIKQPLVASGKWNITLDYEDTELKGTSPSAVHSVNKIDTTVANITNTVSGSHQS